ncbi:MAG: hypothetical protein RR229_07080 [Oscillospiraceae bacterium]
MSYKEVYNLKNNKYSCRYFIPYPFLFISISLYIYSKFFKPFSIYIVLSLALLIFSFCIWSVIVTVQMIADDRYIIRPYNKNQCDVVEGCISNFVPRQRKSGSESFEVSGLKFVYPNESSKIGYREFSGENNYKIRNGLNVRVTYAYDDMLGKDNVIVRLEIEI